MIARPWSSDGNISTAGTLQNTACELISSGAAGHEVAPRGQHARGILQRVERRRQGDQGPDRVQPELKAGDDAEVAAGAADGPEEVRVLRRAGGPHLPVGGDDVDREEVVDDSVPNVRRS